MKEILATADHVPPTDTLPAEPECMLHPHGHEPEMETSAQENGKNIGSVY